MPTQAGSGISLQIMWTKNKDKLHITSVSRHSNTVRDTWTPERKISVQNVFLHDVRRRQVRHQSQRDNGYVAIMHPCSLFSINKPKRCAGLDMEEMERGLVDEYDPYVNRSCLTTHSHNGPEWKRKETRKNEGTKNIIIIIIIVIKTDKNNHKIIINIRINSCQSHR